jgi:hypothetical protein
MATTSPASLAAGRADQQQLLALLGNDDPADVAQATASAVQSLVKEAGSDLATRPAAAEWSVLELVGHLVDAEIVMSGRYRWAISQDQPPLLGYDQDLWVARLRHNEARADELLAVFGALRAANLRLWRRSTAQDRERVAMHSERGPESYGLMFRMLAGHDRFHLNQMRETLRLLREPR